MINKELSLISELRAILFAHPDDSEVKSVVAQVVADGKVTPDELARVRAVAALALSKRDGPFAAFAAGPLGSSDPALLAEIRLMRETFVACPDASAFLDSILADGKISKMELLALREIRMRVASVSAIPSASPEAYPFPKPRCAPKDAPKSNEEEDD